MTGPNTLCVGQSGTFSIPPPLGATHYNWTVTPSGPTFTTPSTTPSRTINFPSPGTYQVCVNGYNLCQSNPTTSCKTVTVLPTPTATISGNGVVCTPPASVPMTVTFTGTGPWTFTPSINGVAQPPITTSSNPYVFTATQVGTYTISNLNTSGCPGTVSGTGTVTLGTINANASTTPATCGQANGSATATASGGTTPYTFSWSNGGSTPTISNVPPGNYTVTVSSPNGCTAVATANVPNNPIPITLTGVVSPNTGCGSTMNGSINLTVTPAGTPVVWSNGSTATSLTNLAPGTYSVTATIGTTCSQTAAFTIENSPNNPTATTATTPTTCGNSAGTATVTPAGGLAPYTIAWGGGQTTNTITGLTAGTYSATVTGANGCTVLANATVPNVNTPITITGTPTANTSCQPTGNGAINISVTPAGTPVLWSNGSTSTTLTNLSPGTYTVTATISASCTQVASFTIDNNPNLPTATTSTTGTTCGSSTGSATVSPAGGVAPYTFTWSTGGTGSTINDLASGGYTVTVTAANGCSVIVSANVPNTDTPITITATTVANTTCTGGNGSITATATPPDPTYTYTWSNGEVTPAISNLAPGTYTLTVSAGGSCNAIASFTVPNQPDLPVVMLVPTPTTCGQSDGTITATITGNSAPYDIIWTNGETSTMLTGLTAGVYSATVTGANGCTQTASTTVGNNNPPITITGTVTQNMTCLPTGDGAITTTASPAGPPYTFMWSTGDMTSDISGLLPGSYTVTVSAGGTCTAAQSFVIQNQPDEPLVVLNTMPSMCSEPNGSITSLVTGAVAPYTFVWSNGPTDPDQSNLPPGTYTVTVTAANGCSQVAATTIANQDPTIIINGAVDANSNCVGGNGGIDLTFLPAGSYSVTWSNGSNATTLTDLPAGVYSVTATLTGTCTATSAFVIPFEPDPPLIDAVMQQSTCGESNGAIDLTVSGGVPPYAFIWSNGSTSEDLTNLGPLPFIVTVTDAVGCTSSTTLAVTEQPLVFSIASNTSASTVCTGTQNGAIDIFVDPPGIYTYTWSTGASGTTSLSNLPPGNYGVVVSAGGNCQQGASFSVEYQPEFPDVLFDVTSNATCGQPTGSVTVFSFNGVPSFDYTWSTGSTSETLTNLAPGDYTATVTSGNGCTSEGTIAIQDEQVAIELDAATIDNNSCTNPTGAIDLTFSPSNLTFLWSPNAGGATTPDLTGLAPDDYTVTVSAGGTCSATLTASIVDFTEPITLETSATPSTCGSATGSATVTVTSGAPPFSYKWNNLETTPTISNLQTGAYEVTVTSATTGCTNTILVDVPSQPIAITITPTVTPNTSCSATKNGGISIAISPANPYTIKWSQASLAGQNLTGLAPGAYTVTVSLGTGCSQVATINVPNQTTLPSVSANAVASTCELPNGSATATVSGGVSPINMVWTGGATTSTISNLSAGVFSVTATDALGCSATATATVANNNPPINLTAAATPLTSCVSQNGAIDLTVSPVGPSYVFSWTGGATTEDLQNLNEGNFSVTVTAGGACSAAATFSVPNATSLPILTENVASAICQQPNGAIDLSVAGGTMPYVFNWQSGETTEDLTAVLAGNYVVTVTAANGCTASATINVPNSGGTFDLAGVASPLTNCKKENGAVDLTITPPVGAYTIVWSNGATTTDLVDLPAGTYSVSVTESGNCTATASFFVEDKKNQPLAQTAVAQEVCGLKNGSVNLTITGGTQPFSFAWASGETSEDLAGIAAGAYAVTMTDANDCSVTAAATVPAETINFSVQPAIQPNTVCGMGTNGAIDLTVSPAGAYDFSWLHGPVTEDLTALLGGDYSVTVSAGGTCTASFDCSVASQIDAPAISQTISPALCTSQNGSIGLSVSPVGASGGPFSFNWSNGAAVEDLTGLAAGAYSVTVTAANGCSAFSSFLVPTDSILIALTAQPTQNTFCKNGNGALNLTASPVGVYDFNWSNGEKTEDLAGLVGGNFSVTATDANGCTAVGVFSIDDQPATFSLSGQPTINTLCVGGNAAINVTPSVAASYVFDWSNGEKTEDLADLTAGNYTVTATNAATGCTATATFSVQNQPANFALSAQPTLNTLCVGGNGALDLTMNPPSSGYTFSWSTGSTDEDLKDLTAGQYTVTVTDAQKCTATATFDVANVPPNFTATPAPTANTVCVGQKNGAVNLTMNPAGVYTFLWSSGSTTEDLAGLAAGTFSVTVTDAQKCTLTATATVAENAPTVILTGSKNDVKCFGDANGSISVTASGGLGALNYTWSPTVAGSQTNPTGLSGGAYSLTVSDAGGCADTIAFSINEPTSDVQMACKQSVNVSVPGASDGQAGIDIFGGTAPYTVDWSPGGLQNGVGAGLFSIQNLSEGNYAATVTDANGCSTVCQFGISTVICETEIGTMTSSLQQRCGAGCLTATYDATGQFLDADDILEYILHEGTGNQIVNEKGRSATPTFCFDAATMQLGKTYFISAVAGTAVNGQVNLADFCTVVAVGSPIKFNEVPIASVAPPDPLRCTEPTQVIAGQSSMAGSTFAWTGPQNSIVGAANSATITGQKAGNFQLIVTAGGCADTVSVALLDITNQPAAVITASPDDILDCKIDEIQLSGTVNGTGSPALVWTFDDNFFANGSTVTIAQPGQYEFIVVDTITLCADTALIEIDENSAYPPLTASTPTVLTCKNLTAQLSGGSTFPGIAFEWATIQNGDTTIVGTGPTFSATEPGQYFLFGEDPANGCRNAIFVNVLEDKTPPVADAGQGFLINCFGANISLDGSGSTGQTGLLFTWTTADGKITAGATTAAPSINVHGTYFLTIENPQNGCTDTDSVVIVRDEPIAIFETIDPKCFGDGGTVRVKTVTGGQPPYQLSLDGGQTFTSNTSLSNVQPGQYSVFIRDAGGCEATSTATINAVPLFEIGLVDELEIKMGDSIQFVPTMSIPLDQIESLSWYPPTGLSCDTCLAPFAKPFSTTEYWLRAVTETGCLDSASLKLHVDRQIGIYPPTAFSPDGDGQNDRFLIFANPAIVVEMEAFLVFDRWGETVHSYFNFAPNDPASGWDGLFRGEKMTPAVYAWFAKVKYIDGRSVLYEGDVTLIR